MALQDAQMVLTKVVARTEESTLPSGQDSDARVDTRYDTKGDSNKHEHAYFSQKNNSDRGNKWSDYSWPSDGTPVK